MTTTVRLPPRVEQALATYCLEKRRTKSEVIVALLEERLLGSAEAAAELSAFEHAQAAGFIGSVEGSRDTAARAKKLVRQKIRAKHTR
ncbi:MAG: hypothetical protein FJY56_01425 [Betaproteobacteria bacterium]|nr:hypothetical protein [Betaproteobacteria bacterium]